MQQAFGLFFRNCLDEWHLCLLFVGISTKPVFQIGMTVSGSVETGQAAWKGAPAPGQAGSRRSEVDLRTGLQQSLQGCQILLKLLLKLFPDQALRQLEEAAWFHLAAHGHLRATPA
jgi:hypothetical protein